GGGLLCRVPNRALHVLRFCVSAFCVSAFCVLRSAFCVLRGAAREHGTRKLALRCASGGSGALRSANPACPPSHSLHAERRTQNAFYRDTATGWAAWLVRAGVAAGSVLDRRATSQFKMRRATARAAA